jgi:hemoglobin
MTLAAAIELDRLGGEEGVRRWVNKFYDLVAQSPVLAPIFPPDLALTRAKQWAYFVEFFGGPPLYTQAYGRPFLRFKHRHAKIGRPERDTWMELLETSLRETSGDGALAAAVAARIAPIADAMVNHDPTHKNAYFFN